MHNEHIEQNKTSDQPQEVRSSGNVEERTEPEEDDRLLTERHQQFQQQQRLETAARILALGALRACGGHCHTPPLPEEPVRGQRKSQATMPYE